MSMVRSERIFKAHIIPCFGIVLIPTHFQRLGRIVNRTIQVLAARCSGTGRVFWSWHFCGSKKGACVLCAEGGPLCATRALCCSTVDTPSSGDVDGGNLYHNASSSSSERSFHDAYSSDVSTYYRVSTIVWRSRTKSAWSSWVARSRTMSAWPSWVVKPSDGLLIFVHSVCQSTCLKTKHTK